MTSLRAVWTSARISTMSSSATCVTALSRMSSARSSIQDEAMDWLPAQNVHSDCYYLIKSIDGFSRIIQNIRQRVLPFKLIYDFGEHSGLNDDITSITSHVNGTDTINECSSN